MRRILNLNQAGMVFVKVISLFMLVIPVVLYGIRLLFRGMEIVGTILRMIKISFAAGVFILIVFVGLVILEQAQDHCIDVQYQKQRHQKRLLANGNYECQYCGNQRIKEHDKTCGVCGKELL